MGEGLGALPVAHVHAEAPGGVVEEGSGRVVNRVGVGRRAGHLLVDDLELLRGLLQRLGVPSNAERIDLWRRYAHPLASLTLLLLSWPLLAGRRAHTRREGLAGIGFGVILSLGFWLLNQSLEMAGKQSLLPVWIAVWGAHLLSIPFSTYLLLCRQTH